MARNSREKAKDGKQFYSFGMPRISYKNGGGRTDQKLGRRVMETIKLRC